MRLVLNGTVASSGMTIGRARRIETAQITIDSSPLEAHQVTTELEHLKHALDEAKQQLRTLQQQLHGKMAEETTEFIQAHTLLLSDPELVSQLKHMIRDKHMRASQALKAERDRLMAMFNAMEDPYLRSRSEDIDQVLGRVLNILQRQDSPEERKLAARVGEILISRILAPADLASLAGRGLLGVVTLQGNTYSHSAILARNLNLPMLIGVADALDRIRDNDLILLDAENGHIIIHPTGQDLAQYRAWQREVSRKGKRLTALAGVKTTTRDHVAIELYANAEQPADLALARTSGASGIGLYRSEFLFLHGQSLPSEDEQFSTYRHLVLAMDGLPVTIRTLDLGADKAGHLGITVANEENPALGVRGVRLMLRNPTIFATQLRAILRAASYGPVRILVPMVTQVDEILSVRTLIKHCLEDLYQEGHHPPKHVDVGAMIEVPAAALAVESLIEQTDFLALGTNDMAQYLLASDRNNDALGNLYSPLQPALLRLIYYVIRAADKAGKPISLCGEMASDSTFTELLLALGLKHFSVHPNQILAMREHIMQLEHQPLRRMAGKILHASSTQEIADMMKLLGKLGKASQTH